MKRLILWSFCVLVPLFLVSQSIQYPVTEKTDTVDVYFGVKVADPYRWLEDDMSAKTAAWVGEQNVVTEKYLSGIPFRNNLKDRFAELWNYERYGVPFCEGKYYFFFKNTGLQNQSVLYVREGLAGEPSVLLDPNTFSTDGTVALQDISVSHDARHLAFSVSSSGSDWQEIRVMEIASRKVLADTLRWVKFSSIAWKGSGFYYSRYDAPAEGMEKSGRNENHKLCYHQLGTSQLADKLVFSDPEHPLRNFSAQVTEDERFLLIYASESSTGNALYCVDERAKAPGVRVLVSDFENDYGVLDHTDGKLIVVTNYAAPKQQLIMMDPENPSPKYWKTLIPEKEEVLRSVHLAGGLLIAEYMKDACSKAYIHGLDGEMKAEIELPGIGTLGGFSGKKEDSIAFYAYSSYNFPTTIYRFSLRDNKSAVYFSPAVKFDPQDITVRQVFYNSKDGTRVPMFIIHKKDITMNGENPCFLYGYGGFNVSMTPGFSVSRIPFLEKGGVYAVPNIRGGGEYGEAWHEAGTRLQKQNVFDDFIAAAEYLIKAGYTKPEKLAISGGSNGGLLVGACMTQRPELFRVALPAVGVLDMLRYHKFTIGWAWAGDYGTSDNKEEFEALYKYSPLHNLRKGTRYPATLITTADHDDRVVPAHSFKFAASLQECQGGELPVLIRIESKAGHGGGKPMNKVIQEAADVWSFVFYHLGIN